MTLTKKVIIVIFLFPTLFALEALKREINKLNRTTIFLNLFNLDYNVQEADIRDYFKDVARMEIDMRFISKGVVDILLGSKDEALQIAEIGGGVHNILIFLVNLRGFVIFRNY